MTISPPESKRASAFTLVELIAVIGIIVLLAALGIPAVQSLGKAGGRKTAISAVMNSIERARMLALSTNRPTYLAFADNDAPEDYRYNAFAIFREGDIPGDLVQETAWKKLPTGISFRRLGLLTSGTERAFRFPGGTDAQSPYVKFDITGAVEEPQPSSAAAATNLLRVAVFEGWIEDTREVSTRGGTIAAEEVRIARYTGRPRLVVQ